MLEAGTLIKGRFKVTGLLSKGGMSLVYNAIDQTDGKHLVIKEAIRRQTKDDQTMEQSLVIEGNMLKKLSNPHLPKIYDVIEDYDHIMIVMDFVDGQSLDKVLAQYGAAPAEQAIDWAIQICDLLFYLHSQLPPIIYRDMKPANVILQNDGVIRMIDFGTARTWKGDSDRTSDTVMIGTEGFAAPEQYGGYGESDARTDIFCLGATIFNLVTNHSPYSKPFGITPLGMWIPELENGLLDQVIQKCTARDPNSRYQNALELKEALLAARANPGTPKKGLKALFGNKGNSGSISGSQGWMAPSMSTSDGSSEILIAKQEEQIGLKSEGTGGLKKSKGTAPFKTNERVSVYSYTPGGHTGPMADVLTPQGQPVNPGASGPMAGYQAYVPPQYQPEQDQTQDVWKKTALISLIISVCLLLVGIVLVAVGVSTGGIVCMVFAAAAMVMGIISAIFYLKR